MRRLLAAAVAVLAVVLAGPAAQAATWSAPDTADDVAGTRYDPEPQPCGATSEVDASRRTDLDIRRLWVRHGRRDVVVTVRFADLVDDRRSHVEVPMLTPRGDYAVLVDVSPRGRVRTTLLPGYQTAVRDQDPDDCGHSLVAVDVATCRGLRAARSTADDTVHLVVPRSCLGAPYAVRVGASSHGYAEGTDETYRVFSDRWAPTEEARGRFVHGPWVRRQG